MPTLGTSGSPTGVDGDDDAVRVFMSYRRTDDANFTGRFHDKLIGVFGDANVFRDIDSIPAGTKFEDVITARLADVDAVVALIGSTWDARIGSPSDFVRMEIAHALQSDTPVIPVLIEDTPLPTPDGLPDDLKPMLHRQTVRVRRDPDFHRDAARVIDGVREAVAADRIRLAALRKAEQETAQRRREEEQRRQELEAELARANARAAQERKAADALAVEREHRLVELARLEEEATQRRIADERARVAQIVESQAAREREAEAAVARAEQLRRELGDLPPVTLTEMTAEVEPEAVAPAAAAELAMDEAASASAVPDADVADVVEPEVDQTETSTPVLEETVVPASARTAESTAHGPPARSWFPSSPNEWIGVALQVIATTWAVWALFRRDLDGSNAFTPAWPVNVAAVLLTASLLLPLLCFRFGVDASAVAAGSSLGYLAFQGFPSSDWFWNKDYGDEFPVYMVFIALILAGAWFALRAGDRAPTAMINHAPSRWLQIAASVAAAVAVMFFADMLTDWFGHTPKVWAVYLLGTLAMVALSTRRSRQASMALALLAAACAVTFLSFVMGVEGWEGKAWNVVIASGLLAATAFWRSRRATTAAGN